MLNKRKIQKLIWLFVLFVVVGAVSFGVLRACQRAWLLKGIETNDAALIKKAFKWGFPKSAQAQAGLPALSKAVLLGHEKAARALVEQGADLKAKTTEKVPSAKDEKSPVIPAGTGPLGVAAYVCYLPGSPEMARLLLENGLSPDEMVDGVSVAEIVSDQAESHLQQTHCWEMLRSLLEAGLNVNSTAGEELYQDVMSGSALWVRLLSAHIPAELVEEIISRPDINLNAQSKAGISGLMQAAFLNRPDVAELLLKAGADPNLKAEKGFTALDISKQLKYPKVKKVLLKYGAAN